MSGEEKVSSSMALEWPGHLEYDDASEEGVVIDEKGKNGPIRGVTQGIYDFLSWMGSNIQEFLGWAGGNIWDFLAWAGFNTYEASVSLGKGGIIFLLILLLIIITYGATTI